MYIFEIRNYNILFKFTIPTRNGLTTQKVIIYLCSETTQNEIMKYFFFFYFEIFISFCVGLVDAK